MKENYSPVSPGKLYEMEKYFKGVGSYWMLGRIQGALIAEDYFHAFHPVCSRWLPFKRYTVLTKFFSWYCMQHLVRRF